MRIALVSHYMPPHTAGVEHVCALLSRAYADAGHEVTWLATATPLPPGETTENGVTQVRLASLNVLERRFSMPFPIIGPGGWRRISRAVREAEIVHINDCLYPTSLAAARAATSHDRPFIVTQHVAMVSFGGGLVDPLLAAAYRTVGRRVLRAARHVAFVSENVRDWFAREVASDIRGSLIPNAVDTAQFHVASDAERRSARAAFGLAADARVVIFAGRLVPKKNVRVLAAAIAAMDAHLFVVGDGPDRDALEPLGDRVTHVPRVPHARMHEAFAAADVFALPSAGEGLPLSLIEALASGLPCVVSRDRAFEALAECEAVVRADATPTGVAGALGAVLASDETARSRLAGAARTWAQQRYGLAAFSARYLGLLEEIGSA